MGDPSVPFLVLPGNHDVGDKPNTATIQEYTEAFGDDFYSFWCRGVKRLVLNTAFWKDDSDATELRGAHDLWLRHELGETAPTPEQRLLVFGHISPFLFEPN